MTLDPQALTAAALDAALNARVKGGASVYDYFDLGGLIPKDAEDLGVNLGIPGRWHWHSDIRSDEIRDTLKIVLGSAIQAYLSAGWQDISTAPKDGEDTLVTDARLNGGFPQVVYWEEGRWHLTDGDVSYHPEAFTHWRRDCLTTPSIGSGRTLADANSKSPIQAREE